MSKDQGITAALLGISLVLMIVVRASRRKKEDTIMAKKMIPASKKQPLGQLVPFVNKKSKKSK